MSRQVSTDPRKAVAYLRVSTEDQKLGPEAQRAQIEQWSAREGVEIVSWHVDQGVSGGADLDARPALVAALGDVKSTRSGLLVVAKRDRLARDVYVASTIERAAAGLGARVVAADGTANGDTAADAFMRTILDAAAAYERGLIKARTKAALQAKISRGELVGSVPYGFRLNADGRTLERDEAEQAILRDMRELQAGGLTVRAIACALAARGIVSLRTGRPYNHVAVHRMLSAA